MADGRIVIDIGENRKRCFKSKLYSTGITMTDWLKETVDKFINDNNDNNK